MPNPAAARTAPLESAPSDLAWRVLGLVNLYRLLVAGGLFAASGFELGREMLSIDRPGEMAVVCALYFFAGIGLIALRRVPFGGLRTLTLTHAVVDSTAMGFVLWAAGGVTSGLGILLLLPVAAMALLAYHRDAFFTAALASCSVLLQQAVVNLHSDNPTGGYIAAGVLGAVIFIAAISVRPLANRLIASEALVRRHELDLANLSQLSQYIVQHLRESIIVVDAQDRIRLINQSAAEILGNANAWPDALLGECSPRLLFLLSGWRQHRDAQDSGTFPSLDGSRLIQPHFAQLGGAQPSPVLIFLEDTSLLAEKVQQSKLAALGRLSASIAHEIRTPVGAMSHAGQLLAESAGIAPEEKRLTQIIRDNAERVSRIIENVLQFSRRGTRRPERLELGGWINDFWVEFCATQQIGATQLSISAPVEESRPLEIRVDPTQLQQVLANLCQNALTHGRRPEAPGVAVEIRYGRLAGNGRPFVEIIDRGPGIAREDLERVFEPFFTRAPRGTGLGLFLARELAQANGATLLHESPSAGGSLFRLVFSDPGRWEE
jgi:two-component system sensor histidine kinase PilS (NtrC family)